MLKKWQYERLKAIPGWEEFCEEDGPHNLECLKEAIKQFPASVEDQEKVWCKATGKSGEDFLRLKRAYGMEGK